MVKKTQVSCCLVLLWVSAASGQSESVCPANKAMGLCTEVAQPCFSDNDCYNGEICCPEACSRTCKPRNGARVSGDSSIPDLLNDPRVYVGKCPDASCYSLFGGEPNECSTSNLCPTGQFCCNDGCKNICRWKPEYAALIAQEQKKARRHQQLIIQKQQDEMRRKQQEMTLQRQRQLASAELARKKAEAIAAAEAELAAYQARAKFEAGLKAVAGAQARGVANQQQMAVLQHYPNQQPELSSAPQPSLSAGGSFDNILSGQQTVNSNNNSNMVVLQQPRPQQTPFYDTREFGLNKKDFVPGGSLNHINSPANRNPYSLLSHQSVLSKAVQEDLFSRIHSTRPSALLQNQDLKQAVPGHSVTSDLSVSAPQTNTNLAIQNPVQNTPLTTTTKLPSASPLNQPVSSALSQKLRSAFPGLQARTAPPGTFQPALVSNRNLNQPSAYNTRQFSPSLTASSSSSNAVSRQPSLYAAQESASRYPAQDQGPLYPAQDQGPRYPAQDQAPRYPAQDRGPRYPAQDQAPRYPAQDQGPRYPAQDQAPRYPAQDQGPRYPTQDQVLQYPTQNQASRYSAQNQAPLYAARDQAPTYPIQTYIPPRNPLPYQQPVFRRQMRQDSMTPFWMYQMMQTAA